MSNGDEPIKKNVQIELEVDANAKTRTNKFQTLIDLAETVDAWRIFPRLFISAYIYVFYQSSLWIMNLDAPTTQQASIYSVITSIGAAWFAAYLTTGSKHKSRD